MWSLVALSSILAALGPIEALPVSSSSTLNETSSTASASFPTNIGYLGPTGTGVAPFLAETDGVPVKTGSPKKPYTLPQPWEAAQAYDHKESDESIFHYMGSLSPYYVSDGWGVYDYGLPDQCKISKVEMLSRHGSRYTDTDSAFLKKITAANYTASGNLSFLNGWTYKLGTQILTSLGNQQLFDKGVRTFFRYGGLYDYNEEKIVARTTSEERMTMTALYFLNGYYGLNWKDYVDLEIIIEDDGFNNTYAPWNDCPNSDPTENIGYDIVEPLIKKYLTPAVERFNKQIKGFKFDYDDVYGMQTLCAYETNNLGYSKFCSLFSQKEWEWYGYIQDVVFFYSYSFGNPTSRASGIGLVTELNERLTNTKYSSDVQSTQNSTLDSDPEYFPLDQKLYLDFTHDTIIVNMLTALGFKQFNSTFNLKGPGKDNSTFKTSQLVPFAAQLFFEVIECDEAVPANRSALAIPKSKPTKYIHAILNDHTLSLSKNVPEYCESRVDGWCKLDKFVEYLDTLYDASKFEESCFGKYNLTQVVKDGVPLK